MRSVVDFRQSVTEFFSRQGWHFLTAGSIEPSNISLGNRVLATMASAVAFGPAGALATSAEPGSSSQVASALARIIQPNEVGGIKLETGAPNIIITLSAEKLDDSQILGFFGLVDSELPNFKTFAVKVAWGKLDVMASIFVIFESSIRAAYFDSELKSRCKKTHLFKKAFTVPWTVDLERQRVIKYSGIPLGFLSEQEVQMGLFP